jgi:SPP1 gp7 family putative phage head morphogenesis protein
MLVEIVWTKPGGTRDSSFVQDDDLPGAGSLAVRARRFVGKRGKLVSAREVEDEVPEARSKERDVGRSLLTAEAQAFTRLFSAVQLVTTGLVAATVLHRFTGSDGIYAATTSHGQSLSHSATVAILDSRIAARQAARATLASTATAVATASDRAHALAAGASLSSQWTSLTLGKVNQWRASPDKPLGELIKSVETPMQPRVARTAAVETAQAFNDERRIVSRNTDADTTWVWSAVLDQRTCPECDALDGKSWRSEDDVPASPPIHPMCRCVLIPVARK